MNNRPFHIVVWGASGFTGRLVCEHVAQDYHGKISWAMAGRSKEKLESIREDLVTRFGPQLAEVPILLGSLDDPASLEAIAQKTRVLISTAGPFNKIGTPIVDSAVKMSTHYVDITGEVPWVSKLITTYHDIAAEKNVRIVPCCGYDSVPADLGAFFVVENYKKRFGRPPTSVTTVVEDVRGSVSGGTIASAMDISKERARKKKMAGVKDPREDTPYELIPANQEAGTDVDTWWGVERAPAVIGEKAWFAPSIMQVCDTRVVHRSNYLLGWGGPNFHCREYTMANGYMKARASALLFLGIGAALSATSLHFLLKKMLPAQGEGPTREQMINGYYKQCAFAEGVSQENGKETRNMVVAEVGDEHRDPGYWGTSRLVLECALCLACQQKELDDDDTVLKGGILTPASALGMYGIARLRAAGIHFRMRE
jgi:short subunit dehydrogenase-like uncharacterized protein